MAKINLSRRAEIGQERRARTRAILVSAATTLIAERPIEAITVDEIVKEAGVAKGTFYVHFVDMDALIFAVAEEFIDDLDQALQPQQIVQEDPLDRIAFGCGVFIERAINDPPWGLVVGRMAATYAWVGDRTKKRLLDDLRDLYRATPPVRRRLDPAVATEVVVGIVLQTLVAIGQGRLNATQARSAISAILSSIGIEARTRASVIKRVTTLLANPAAQWPTLASTLASVQADRRR